MVHRDCESVFDLRTQLVQRWKTLDLIIFNKIICRVGRQHGGMIILCHVIGVSGFSGSYLILTIIFPAALS